MQCDNFPSERTNLPPNSTLGHFPSVQEDGSEPSWETATVSPQQSLFLGRWTASQHTPHSSGTLGRSQDGCVDSGERQRTAELLHKPEASPRSGDSNDSLNRAVRPETPLATETAPLLSALPQKGPQQYTLEKWGHLGNEHGQDQTLPPQRVVRQEKPPPFLEVRSQPAAFRLPPPLPRSKIDLEVQSPPPPERAPYGGARKAMFVTPRIEVPPVRRDRPRVSKPPWAVTTISKRCSRQTPRIPNRLTKCRLGHGQMSY